MNRAVLFSSKSDEYVTPQAFFDKLHAEFGFDLDAAARADNAKCRMWYGPGSPFYEDALTAPWRGRSGRVRSVWLNPPYSRGSQARFIQKAHDEVWLEGAEPLTVVLLLPVRTDTKHFHRFIWSVDEHRTRPGVEIRLVRGRLRFRGVQSMTDAPDMSGAPFPSMVVIMRKPRPL